MLLLSMGLGAALPASPASAGVLDNVITQWRVHGEACDDGKIWFPEAPMQVAMFEAINAITPKYRPYAKRIDAAPGASVDAAAAQAAHDVLAAMCPDQTDDLKSALEKSLKAVTDESAREAGMRVGKAAAAAVLAARADSGHDARDPVFEPPGPGVYAPTIPQVGLAISRQRPWILRTPDEVRPGPPPALSSDTWARDFNEIKALGAKKSETRSAAQTDSANFWKERSTAIVLEQLIGMPGRSLVDDARFLALAEMALNDSYVAMMDGKYHYDLWRPITAIRHADIDGNDATAPDPAWLNLDDTPNQSEYPCGHCLSAAAIGEVIAREFGTNPPPIVLQAEDMLLRRFDTPREFVDDVAQSRIWLGVHYRFSVDAGVAAGTAIGALATQRHFLPLDRSATAAAHD
ncbi:MAG: vanadium-dependent haloperoxidase [Silanimonas sp.]